MRKILLMVITTVILVRHAEQAGATGDVPLSPAGITRAKELVRVLAGTSIAAIYVTPYVRTEQTAAPLATAHHVDPVIIKNMDTYARDVVSAILRDHKGDTVVVVGHSNTTPQVIRTLGIPNPPEIADGEYDGLFIVSVADGAAAKLVTLKYGAALQITGTVAGALSSSSLVRTNTRAVAMPARCKPFL